MKNLSINFYGEEVSINCPKDFVSLRKEIAKTYELSLSDILEIDISYNKDEVKKVIKTEIDFKTFLHSRISKLNLDISEKSVLFQKNLVDLQKKAKDDLTQLETLKKKKEENKKKQEKEYAESKKKVEDLNKKIKELGQKKLEYVKNIKNVMRGPRNKEKELVVKITKLGKEIGAPLIFTVPEKGPLPIKGETEKEKKLVDLIKRNTDCLKVQEQLYSTPRKNMADMDKEIKEINKKCLYIIKNSQKEMMALKKEEHVLIKEIIDLEKKLGLSVDEKKPMKKAGFFIPNRKNVEIKTIKNETSKKEEEGKLKNSKQRPEIKLSLPKIKNEKREINKKIENVVKNLRKNICDDVEKHIMKSNEEIKKIKDKALENNYKLQEKDKKYLEKCQEQNNKTVKEIDKWIEFIFVHSHELIEAVEKQNEIDFKKFKEIEKKVGIKEPLKSEKEKVLHPGITCISCKGPIYGIRYKCTICTDFDFCEKCEEKDKGEHGHPLLKLNSPEMCPVDIKCILK